MSNRNKYLDLGNECINSVSDLQSALHLHYEGSRDNCTEEEIDQLVAVNDAVRKALAVLLNTKAVKNARESRKRIP